MPSGKKSKQLRQAARTAPPPVRAKGAPRQRQASPRVLIGAGAVALTIAVAVVLVVVFSGGSSNSTTNAPAVGSISGGLPEAAGVEAMFKGIPQTPTTLGHASAPVTMTEYIDLQCPYCQEFETQVFPNIVTKFVRTGKLKVVIRPWAFIGPDSVRGQAAVLAAGAQHKAFNYAELLYDNQGTENTGWLDSAMVSAAAASIPGLPVHEVLAAVSSSTVKVRAQDVDALATANKVTHTPTIYVGKSGTRGPEVALKSPTDQATLVQAIESA
jgi:protein-disulfide isomerase